RGPCRSTGYQGMPGQARAHDDRAPLSHAHHVQHALCQVDPEAGPLWFPWTRLLWLYECTALARMVAHRSRAAQGAGPFHYDPSSQGTKLWFFPPAGENLLIPLLRGMLLASFLVPIGLPSVSHVGWGKP